MLDRETFWHSVAFANIVQDLLPDSNTRPSEHQVHTGLLALADTIDETQPDLMLVYSAAGWGAFGRNLREKPGYTTSRRYREDFDNVWLFGRPNLPHLLAARVNHPARLNAPREVWTVWIDLVWRLLIGGT